MKDYSFAIPFLLDRVALMQYEACDRIRMLGICRTGLRFACAQFIG